MWHLNTAASLHCHSVQAVHGWSAFQLVSVSGLSHNNIQDVKSTKWNSKLITTSHIFWSCNVRYWFGVFLFVHFTLHLSWTHFSILCFSMNIFSTPSRYASWHLSSRHIRDRTVLLNASQRCSVELRSFTVLNAAKFYFTGSGFRLL